MNAVYVVDTGDREIYVLAGADYEAAEAVAALGEKVNYVEHYSDDVDDVPEQYRDTELFMDATR